MMNQNNMQIVYDTQGSARRLGTFINSGGEGKVYSLLDNSSILVKIYSNSERAQRQQQKIMAMSKIGALRSNRQLAWPQLDIYDKNGDFIGFAMGSKDGFSLNQLGVPQLVVEKLSHWTRQHLVEVALSLVKCVKELHKHDILIGDVNPGNFLVDRQTATVSFIDCDSYQVKAIGQTFLCEVGMQQFMAPEFLDKDMKHTPRTKEQDRFSIAIMLYRIFMFGAHPYSRINGQDPVSNLKSGESPLGIGSGCRFPRGNWYNYWSHLPYKMKDLFIKMFRNGHHSPVQRPALNKFNEALEAYKFGLKKGFHTLELMPCSAKSSEYNGNSDKI
jgi:DNA-binding helix-hairpin-helix protein with protein kinase domain